MRKINKIFCEKIRSKDYWNPYRNYGEYTNAPKIPGKYQVLALFTLSDIAIELEARWNGCDWIVPNDGDEISGMVKAWREIE